MPAISVNTDQDHAAFGARVRLTESLLVHTTADWAIDSMRGGMGSGRTSLAVVIPVVVGGARANVVAETSLACFMMAASLLAAAHRDEVEQPGYAVLSPAARDVMRPRMVEAFKRAIPQATPEQLATAAEMVLDGFGADAP